jgi:hypothetical protein
MLLSDTTIKNAKPNTDIGVLIFRSPPSFLTGYNLIFALMAANPIPGMLRWLGSKQSWKIITHRNKVS